MNKLQELQIRFVILFGSAMILLYARIYPLFQQDYAKCVQLTKRIPITYLTNICAVEFILISFFGAYIMIQKYRNKKNSYGNSNTHKLEKIYKFLNSHVLALNAAMSEGFWFLHFYNKSLLDKKIHDECKFDIPFIISFFDHTIPFFINIIELYFLRPTFTAKNIISSIVISVIYFTLISIVHKIKHVWPYDLFKHKTYLMVFCLVMIYLLFGVLSSFIIHYVFSKMKINSAKKHKIDN